MNSGTIDSTSIHTILAALEEGSPEVWTPWVWNTIQSVTSLLWTNTKFTIAPDPKHHEGARGVFKELLNSFWTYNPTIAPIPKPQTGINQVQKWVNNNPQRVKHLFRQVKSDSSFEQWKEWFVKKWWVHHCHMHGALFTQNFINHIAAVIGCVPKELKNVYELSRDIKVVETWVSETPDTDEFNLALDAYILSILLRGRFHDWAAKKANVSIIHHPLREVFLDKGSKEVKVYKVSNSERFLTNMIFASALSERTAKARVKNWADNILKVREILFLNDLKFEEQPSEEKAISVAIETAQAAQIRVYSKFVEKIIDSSIALGIAALGSFALNPWTGFTLAVVELAGSHLIASPGDKLLHSNVLIERKLREIVNSEAGRLSPRAEKTSSKS